MQNKAAQSCLLFADNINTKPVESIKISCKHLARVTGISTEILEL